MTSHDNKPVMNAPTGSGRKRMAFPYEWWKKTPS